MNRNRTRDLCFFYDYIIENNMIYFSLANYNAICSGILENQQIGILDIFPKVSENEIASYTGIYKYKDSLLFSPYKQKGDILLYNTFQHSFSNIPKFPNMDFYSNVVFEEKEFLYIISRVSGEVFKIDMQKRFVQRFVYEECLVSDIQIKELVRIDNLVYIPLNRKKTMLVFDLKKERFESYSFPDNISMIVTLCHYDDKFWITGEDKKIYTWNIKEKKAYVCAEFPNSVYKFTQREGFATWFGYSFIYENTLWLFPIYADGILKYNILTESFEKFELCGEEETKSGLEEFRFFSCKYGCVKKYDKKVYFLSSKTRILYELNLNTNNVQRFYYRLPHMYRERIYPVCGKGIMLESAYVGGVEGLFENCLRQNREIIMGKKNMMGQTIHKYMVN